MCSMDNEWPSTSKGYKLLNIIGKGYFGMVWRAEILEGKHIKEHVAIKKIDLEKYGNQKIEEIRKNMLLLNLIDHPNILYYKISILNKQELWLVFDLMEGGSIEKILQTYYPNGIKDQALIATILRETLYGLQYLHNNNQIHRDIKAGNILIGADGSVMISDFGVAGKIKRGKKRNTLIGSPCYMAPEIIDQDKRKGYDSKVDIWSLGITALELACGKPPNSELTTMKLILKIINEEPPKLPKESCWDESFQEFIGFCLVKDPVKRKSADELLKYCKTFFAKAKGKEYIKQKLLKNLPSFDEKIGNITKQLVIEDNQQIPKRTSLIDFDFSCKKQSSDIFFECGSRIEYNYDIYDDNDSDNFCERSLYYFTPYKNQNILPPDLFTSDEKSLNNLRPMNTSGLNRISITKTNAIVSLKGDVHEFLNINEEEI